MKVIFLSDLHLGAKYITDPRGHEQAVCKFLIEKCADADRLYLLGDVLDYWYEYRHVVPRGYVRFLGTLAYLADNGVKVTWLTGNHDIWLFDYLSEELGVEVVDKPFLGVNLEFTTFLLAHGDRISPEDRGFKIISRVFRNRLAQRAFAAVHPRWTVPFAFRWSGSSRKNHSPSDSPRLRETIIESSRRFISDKPEADYLIIGHHHIAFEASLAPADCTLVVLGDWIDKFTYAEFNGEEVTLKKYDLGDADFTRHDPKLSH